MTLQNMLLLGSTMTLFCACGPAKVATINRANDLLLTHCNPQHFSTQQRRTYRCPSNANDGAYERSWSDTGRLRARGTCSAGVPQGKWGLYYNSGRRQSQSNFVQGALEGPYTFWFSNGKKQCDAKFAANKLDGAFKRWHKNGKLRSKDSFAHGQRVGCWTTYHSNGKIESKGPYSHGRKVKKWRFWTPDGRKRVEQFGGQADQGGCFL